jgi:predicted component of type VI protein secretion system
MNQKAILIVVVLLLVVATVAIGSGCSALDPCVRQRDDCYQNCPTVVVVKQICQEKCNFEYDRCKGKY